jgi:hypothetical protein
MYIETIYRYIYDLYNNIFIYIYDLAIYNNIFIYAYNDVIIIHQIYTTKFIYTYIQLNLYTNNIQV